MKRIISGFLLFMFAAILVSGCAKNKEKAFYGSGTLEAAEVVVSSVAGGNIIYLEVDEGDPVTAGQVLAVIDSEKVFLQKRQLLAGLDELNMNTKNAERYIKLMQDNLDNTEKKYERVSALLADKSTTQQNFDDIETAYKAAKTQRQNAQTSLDALSAKRRQIAAQLDLLDVQLEDMQIKAPINGTVVEKYMERGELLRPGGAIVKIADLSKMTIKFYITEAEFGKVKIGGKARLETGLKSSGTFSGTIVWVSPRAEFTPKNVQTREARAELVYAVKVIINNPEGILKIGMPGDIFLD